MHTGPAAAPSSPFRRLFPLLAVPLLFTGCASVPELGALTDRGGTRDRRIVVKLGEQKAYLYHRGKMVAQAPVSSGREGKDTPRAASG